MYFKGKDSLQHFGKSSPELIQLRTDNCATISLFGVVGVIILVILLRFVKIFERRYFCNNWARESPGCIEPFFIFNGLLFLMVVGVENHRAVLGSDIGPLAI